MKNYILKYYNLLLTKIVKKLSPLRPLKGEGGSGALVRFSASGGNTGNNASPLGSGNESPSIALTAEQKEAIKPISSISKGLSFFIFKGKNRIKILILLIFISISGLFYKIFGINLLYILYILCKIISQLLFSPLGGGEPSIIFMKYFCLISMLFSFIMLSRYAIFIFTLYLIKNKKITKSTFKPFFINKFIGSLEEIIIIDLLDHFVDYYYRLLFYYIFVFTFIFLNYFFLYS